MEEKRIGKLRASYLLTAQSFGFLSHDREMLWVPFLAFLADLVVLAVVAVLGAAYFFGFEGASEQVDEVAMYACIFLYYLGSVYVFTYYQGVIAAMVHMRVNGGDPTLSDGLRNSRAHRGKIARWAFFAATVGLILRLIYDKLGWAGKIFSFLGSVAWGILTFFMVPVLVLEQQPGIKESLMRSGQIFRQTWGETLVMNFSLSFFFTLLHLGWIALCALLAFLLMSSVSALIIIGFAFLIGFIVLIVISSVLSAIFKTVLYEYAATGVVPSSFTPELIRGAIKSKKA